MAVAVADTTREAGTEPAVVAEVANYVEFREERRAASRTAGRVILAALALMIVATVVGLALL
jgi:hypothetical protein